MKEKDFQQTDENKKNPTSDAKLMVKPILITVVAVAFILALVFAIIMLIPDESVSQFLTRWEQVTESGDEEAYSEICSQDFKEEYKELYQEAKDMMSNQDIQVVIDDENIEVTPLDDTRYVIKHIPVLLTDKGIDTHKELFIRQEGTLRRKWIIESEKIHFSKETADELKQIVEDVEEAPQEEPVAVKEETPLDTQFRIRQTLEVWRNSWENKDLEAYMDCYADYADITRVTVIGGKEDRIKLTKDQLKEHIERLGKKYDKIQVIFSEPIEIKGDMAEAKASFLQEYSAWGNASEKPVYKDIGTKELQFVKHEVEWKITNENWTVYEGVPVYPESEF
ncbi:hypothetical protein GF312_21620 [Candidatus Poribacteria bacterium]|nr:hypothetical protein [Candidatus Poribacteria bacterium]